MRRAFTLVELLAAVMLFGLIAALLYGGIDRVRQMYAFYGKKEERLVREERLRALLFRDLLQCETMNVSGNDPDYSVVVLASCRHSLYGIEHPSVVWLVLKNGKTLERLESADPIRLPIDPARLYSVHADAVAHGCSMFRFYEAPSGRFATLECADDKLMIEVPR